MLIAAIGTCVLALIISVSCLAVSNMKLWVELKAMKASTHTYVMYDPLKDKNPLTPMPQAERDALTKKYSAELEDF